MQRGDLYLVQKPGSLDPRRQRVYAVVSRQALIKSKYTTVICCPVYSRHDGLLTQVPVGVNEGLKHPSSLHCDELVSLPKSMLTQYVGNVGEEKLAELDRALAVALGLE
ncbi:MAG: type II toxin-antitoxin system PemK/MazF family toxin [Acidobacteriaceae bacterium]|nr:type II toxin-antitoxin system PemK/MazF family toxin [Acidobacteriaceae bacterium]